MILTVDRTAKVQNRAAALASSPVVPGMDRDEYPPAVTSQGGIHPAFVGISWRSPRDINGLLCAMIA